jgi:lipopolysaccharide biosynthesis protein
MEIVSRRLRLIWQGTLHDVGPCTKYIIKAMMPIGENKTLLSQNAASTFPRFVAFYLPQFHPTPYNNEWWGEGFTEWTNVAKARPRFRGHYQPHLPADLGFYDLRLPEVREAQADLAQAHGIYGFCYYHYWFNGRRVLELPLDEVLRLGTPDLPFCICWANENWTRAWDGNNRRILIEQQYSAEDDVSHIRHLMRLFEDRRYIRIEGKALILIYRIELLPDPLRTAEIWREEVKQAGMGDLFLVNVESTFVREPQDPSKIGFDAAVRFQPNTQLFNASPLIRALRTLRSPLRNDRVFQYRDLYERWEASPTPLYRRFECVTPMWDNSARRERKAFMLKDSTPQQYERWLRRAVEKTEPDDDGLRWVFINAWNEWGEGCHLEPCHKWGRAFLEATKRVHELR